jgi:hypothetical protein
MTVERCRAPFCAGPDAQPRMTSGWLCRGCASATRAAVAAMPLMYVVLATDLTPGMAGREGTRATNPHRAPINLTALAAMGQTVDLARSWHVQGAWHLAGRVVRTPGTSAGLTAAVSALLVLHPRLVPSELAPRYAGELLRWHRRVQQLTGVMPGRVRLGIPCPTCNLLGLYRSAGLDGVHCRKCGASWREAEFRRRPSGRAPGPAAGSGSVRHRLEKRARRATLPPVTTRDP